MRVLIALVFSTIAFAQTGAINIIGGKVDLSSAVHTLPMRVVPNTGALPTTGCSLGEMAVVSSATPGQQNYQNSGIGTCVWTQQLNSGTATGGGITMYSATGLTVTANTYYLPIGGGGTASTTETNVDIDSPAAATITNLFVQQSVAIGAGNTAVYTFRKNASSQSVTCTISGASATSCSDTVHSFNVSQGDLLTIQLVTTGTIIVTPNILIAAQFGNITATGTVNTGTAHQTAVYSSAGSAISGAGPGTSGFVLTSNGSSADPTYQAVPGGVTVSAPYLSSSGTLYCGMPLQICTAPVSGNYTWCNQPTSATETANGSALIVHTVPHSGTAWAARCLNISPNSTLDTLFTVTLNSINFGNCGVGFIESGTSKIVAMIFSGQTAASTTQWTLNSYTNYTTFNTTLQAVNQSDFMPRNVGRVRLKYDGTNIYVYTSNDGVSWLELYQEAKASHFTTAPDKFFYGCDSESTNSTTMSGDAYIELLHWLAS